MNLARRSLLSTSAAAVVTAFFGGRVLADADSVVKAIEEFTGGGSAAYSDLINFELPAIAENGNSVPMSVTVDSPMTDDDYVEAVMVFAGGNPNPEVVAFHFTPLSGEAKASTRMRLARTQNVVAIAKLSNGDMHKVNKFVEVTVGGCGA